MTNLKKRQISNEESREKMKKRARENSLIQLNSILVYTKSIICFAGFPSTPSAALLVLFNARHRQLILKAVYNCRWKIDGLCRVGKEN